MAQKLVARRVVLSVSISRTGRAPLSLTARYLPNLATIARHMASTTSGLSLTSRTARGVKPSVRRAGRWLRLRWWQGRDGCQMTPACTVRTKYKHPS